MTTELINGRKVVETEKYKYHILVACFFAFMLDNVDMFTTSIGLPILKTAFEMTTVEAGLVATCMLIGAAIGAWFWGPFADRAGRKIAYIVCLSWYTVFTFSCAFCNTLTPFLVLRFMCGLALGGAWTIGVAYLTDFFPEEQRGRAVSLVQASAVVGMLIVTGTVRFLVPMYSWRVLFYIALLALPLIAYFAWLPESPSWLKMHYQQDGTAAQKPSSAKLTKLLTIPVYRKALLLAGLLLICMQVAYWGANSWVPTYLTSERGLSVEAMTNIVAASYVGALFGYGIFGVMCDKIGRKKTYTIGLAFTAIATFGYMQLSTDSTIMIWAALWGFGCNGLYGPLGSFVSEMIPRAARGAGLGFVWGLGRLASAVVPVAFGALSTTTSLKFCITLVAAIYVIGFIVTLFMRETRGQSMEDAEIEE